MPQWSAGHLLIYFSFCFLLFTFFTSKFSRIPCLSKARELLDTVRRWLPNQSINHEAGFE
jgi:hypothetical protein